ncbi:hypothetical protein B0H11DRAFT_1953149 [Mycena galericulata]|nr:hypothetical protein B0H11DRAFT_1953149 [Mycena galericulata]
MCEHNLCIPRWILYLPFLTSKAIPLVRESAARELNVTPSGVFTSAESVTTTLSSIDSRPLVTTFPLLTGDRHITTLFFTLTSTSAVVTTNANGQVTTSNEVIIGVATNLVSIPNATQSPNAHSPVNPGVIAGPIVATIAVLGIVLWVILRRRKAVLRAQVLSGELIPSKDRPASAQRDILQTETDLRAHHASWEPYLDLTLQPYDSTLTPSSTISTRQMYISN